MHEVFNWGHVNESRPTKRLSLFLGASEINIDDPPPPTKTPQYATQSRSRHGETFIHFRTITTILHAFIKYIGGWRHFAARHIVARGHVRFPSFPPYLVHVSLFSSALT